MLFPMPDEARQATITMREVSQCLFSLVISIAHGMPRDVSRTGVATLNTLARSGPLRITRLADLEGVAQPSMTLLIDKLERLGLVERRRDSSDRRAILISLTPPGLSYLHEREKIGVERLAQLIGDLQEEHARMLASALPAIASLSQSASEVSGKQNPQPRRAAVH